MEQNLNTKFLKHLTKLEPIEFAGIAKFLGVPIIDNDKKPRDFVDILSDVMAKFEALNRKMKKELLKLVK